MSTFNNLGESLRGAWDELSEGWEQLWQKARNSLTRFTPHGADTDSEGASVPVQSSRWALLSAEVHEDEQNVSVRLEAPGLDKDDINIQVDRNALVVTGEKRYRSESTEGHVHVMETAYGRFRRVIPLPCSVDDQAASASYRDGVLTVTLPRSEARTSRRITVES